MSETLNNTNIEAETSSNSLSEKVSEEERVDTREGVLAQSLLLDWDSPDDKGNPQNWSKWKKAFHLYVLSELGLATTVGTSSFSPAIEGVANHFHVSHVAATIPLTIYVLGQALGPCLAAPLSETYGRKGVFLITTPIALLFTLGSGFSHNYATLCVLRFLAGLFGSPSLSVGGGIIVDIFNPIDRSAASFFWVGLAMVGTGLGAILSGFAVQNKGWRWTQWIFIFVTLAGWIPSLFTSESYKKIILARRAKRRGQAPPVDNLSGSMLTRAKWFLTITLFRPFAMLVQEPTVAYFSVYVGVIFSILFSFFDAFPVVFSGVYGFNLGETGISFIGICIGVGIGVCILLVIDRLTSSKTLLARKAKGDFTPLAPEQRLYGAMLGALLITISLFWFGWTSRKSVHWISSEIATIIFGIGAICVSAPCLLYLLEVYGPLYGASAVGANNLLRYILGAVSPLYTRQMYTALGIGVRPSSYFNFLLLTR